MKKVETSDRLKQIMDERGLRQRDILEKCKPFCDSFGVKMSRADLSQWISGKSKPRQNKLTILSMALGVSETWLMGYDVDPDVTTARATGLDEMIKAMGYTVEIEAKTVRIPTSQLHNQLPEEVEAELNRMNAFVSKAVEEVIITDKKTGKTYTVEMQRYKDFSERIEKEIKNFLES